MATPAHTESPCPGLVAETGHLDLLDLGAHVTRPATFDSLPRPGAAREILQIHAVEVVDRRHRAADLEHLGHVLWRVGLGFRAVGNVERCAGGVTDWAQQATERDQLTKPASQGVVDHVLDRDRRVQRLVVGVAPGSAGVVEGLPLGQIQIIVGIAALLQLVKTPGHDVAGWPGTAIHEGQYAGNFCTDLALRLGRKPITAPDVASHDRQTWVADG
ncbi:hypothetical protein D3C77_474660 [compost metagenome]